MMCGIQVVPSGYAPNHGDPPTFPRPCGRVLEGRVRAAVDLAHAALADEGGHVVVPEAVTDVQTSYTRSCSGTPSSQ